MSTPLPSGTCGSTAMCHHCGRRANDPDNPGAAVTLTLLSADGGMPFSRYWCGTSGCGPTYGVEVLERWRYVQGGVARTDAELEGFRGKRVET